MAHGKPVLFGPRTATIRSEVALVTEAEVGFRVNDAHELATKGSALIADPVGRANIAERALELIATNKGASRRYADAVARLASGGQCWPIATP